MAAGLSAPTWTSRGAARRAGRRAWKSSGADLHDRRSRMARDCEASGERGRSARLRSEPRIQRARRRKKQPGDVKGQLQQRLTVHRRGRRRESRGVERAVGTMLKHGAAWDVWHVWDVWRLLIGIDADADPLHASGRADLDPATRRSSLQHMRDCRCNGRHQDGQTGNPGEHPLADDTNAHWAIVGTGIADRAFMKTRESGERLDAGVGWPQRQQPTPQARLQPPV